jgi:hypothetical protein
LSTEFHEREAWRHVAIQANVAIRATTPMMR